MKRFISFAITVCMASTGFSGGVAYAETTRRFPPPQFSTPRELPGISTPQPDPLWREILDVSVLSLALLIAAWLVLHRRSRKGVIALTVVCLAYFGFWREGCVCPIGAIQNVAASTMVSEVGLPWIVGLFFLLPLVATMLFGRVFCAAVCPLGAIQDLVAIKPHRVPEWLDQSLGVLAYLYLGAAVLFAATQSAWIICEYDPFVGFFRLSGTTTMLLLGGAFLLAGVFFTRPYCRWLCPYGVVMSWLAPAAIWKPRIDPVGCIQCKLCRDGCPINAIDTPDPAPLTPETRLRDRRLMARVLIAMPVLIALGVGVGLWMAPSFARMHDRVVLSDRLTAEDAGWVEGVTDSTRAFRSRGESREALAAEVATIEPSFTWGTALLGGFMGLVIGGKLLQHARRPRRDDFEINQPRCVACARCFALCPHHPGNEALLMQVTIQEGKA